MRYSSFACLCRFLLLIVTAVAGLSEPLAAGPRVTSNRRGFNVDVAGVIGRSDIVLNRPNRAAAEAVPVGNGRLGVALWAAGGFTAQLNRGDTLPDRLSPGQVTIPGLSALTGAVDYAGRVDLYHGEFREQGGGMSAKVFVQPGADVLIVDVAGAKPAEPQTVVLRLWAPRSAHAAAQGAVAVLEESWIDDKNPGASGRRFGSLAAVTAHGRDVVAAVTDPLTVTVTFKPYANGHFRVVVAAPHYEGTGDGVRIATKAFTPEPDAAHLSWWKDFWTRAALIKITSKDGAGEYMENLRHLYLYVAAIEKGVDYPGSQAGIADMISAARDEHKWDPSAFWHWNLRMQVAANIGAGLYELNDPYFNLYRGNLSNIERWTRENMKGLPGICIPETMRFNGAGIEYESQWKPVAMGRNCDANSKPYYNARTISTGAEVSLWIWQQYLATGDRTFLADNFPVMASAARFLLAYQKMGSDGLLHTSPSNAHEQQWDVQDPTTDISAIRAVFPATIEAAKLLGKDAGLVKDLETELAKVPALPRTQQKPPLTLRPAAADSGSDDVIAESYQPGAEKHNIENIGLEPVWPYSIIGDDSPLFPVAQRTFKYRPNPNAVDWSFDPIQAARLHLGSEVAATLAETTTKYQGFINGMAKWEASATEFYVEQTGVVADALQECLVQDYDGLIRIAPAIPPGWDFDGSVYVRGRARVSVQIRNNEVTAIFIKAGNPQDFKVRNPWPGEMIDVVSEESGTVVQSVAAAMVEFAATANSTYAIRRHGRGQRGPEFVTGTPATKPKKFGRAQIGLFRDDK